MTRLTLFSLVTIALAGCSKQQPAVSSIGADNETMHAAIAQARETVDFFTDNWKSMPNDGYSLKFPLATSGGEVEHIWFAPDSIEGDIVVARCSNDPVDIPGLQLGDSRELKLSEASDWMILVGNKCYGGFTMQALLKTDGPPPGMPDFEFMNPLKVN